MTTAHVREKRRLLSQIIHSSLRHLRAAKGSRSAPLNLDMDVAALRDPSFLLVRRSYDSTCRSRRLLLIIAHSLWSLRENSCLLRTFRAIPHQRQCAGVSSRFVVKHDFNVDQFRFQFYFLILCFFRHLYSSIFQRRCKTIRDNCF